MHGITYTIFIDTFTNNAVEDIDLPQGTDLLKATAHAVALSNRHYYSNAAIRVGSYLPGAKEATLVWANEVAYQRNLVKVHRLSIVG